MKMCKGQNAKKSDENANAIAGMHFRGIFIQTKWLVFVSCPGTHAEKNVFREIGHINPLYC